CRKTLREYRRQQAIERGTIAARGIFPPFELAQSESTFRERFVHEEARPRMTRQRCDDRAAGIAAVARKPGGGADKDHLFHQESLASSSTCCKNVMRLFSRWFPSAPSPRLSNCAA